MPLPHLTPWAGAMGMLRFVDFIEAPIAACAYRHVLFRMIRRRFEAKGSDVQGGALAVFIAGIFAQAVFGITLVITKGSVPADAILWSRIVIGVSYGLFNLGFAILFAGLTTRAWLMKRASRAEAARHGQQMYYRLYLITAAMMAFGALAAWLS